MANSWLARGRDTDHASPVADPLNEHELAQYRDGHPLADAMPLVRQLLVDSAADAGHVVAVTDANGRLLWAEGDPALRRPPSLDATGSWRLAVLGRNTAQLATPSGHVPLSLRHAEMLLLMAAHPEGITGDQLALWLHGRYRAPVIARAEMSRMRALLGRDVVGSKPHRLLVPPPPTSTTC